jgi:hypothetical protein
MQLPQSSFNKVFTTKTLKKYLTIDTGRLYLIGKHLITMTGGGSSVSLALALLVTMGYSLV